MLSCSCSYNDEYDGDGWTYYIPIDFTILETKRRRRCRSCNELIDVGARCVEFERFQYPQNETQCDIMGGWDLEMDLASYYHCESCGEKYLNLTAAGYCLHITDDMRKAMKDYHEMTGFKKGTTDGKI